MSGFSTKITDHHQVKPALDVLWIRLREVSDLQDVIDKDLLVPDDKQEFDAISRITFGYTNMVLEIGAAIDTEQEIPLEAVSDMVAMIHAHCDDTITALSHVERLQRGLKRPHYGSVRVF